MMININANFKNERNEENYNNSGRTGALVISGRM